MPDQQTPDSSLKLRTARAVKWNAIDRIASQVLYAITGIVLARLLSPEDFGLVGAVLVFQAFASLLIDSGFSYALIQRKNPTRLDYSSVLWFNMGIAIAIYIILYICAPLIARCFGGDTRLIPLSQVIFLSLILNASAIVQTNRLTKLMHVRPIFISNAIALTIGGIIGIWMAINGWGAWAIVWQTITVAATKSLILWCIGNWRPLMQFSMASIRSFFAVGSGMMLTSFLNTVFSYLNNFIVGARVGLAPLGYYTQADKWSKMGVMSLQQTFTSSFLPALADVQDDHPRLLRLCSKMNRMCAYLLMPCIIGLIAMAAPIFHLLFGSKWDLSIPLFILLLVRGAFSLLSAMYTHYLLSIGRTRLIVMLETVRDSLAIIALIATFPFLDLSSPDDLILGVRILLWGQVAAAFISWFVALITTCRTLGASVSGFILDLTPYTVISLAVAPLLFWLASFHWHPALILTTQAVSGLAIYLLVNKFLGSVIQQDVFTYLRGRMK